MIDHESRFNNVHRSLLLLNKGEKRRLVGACLIQSVLGILDLVGVMAIGLIGAISIAGMQGRPIQGSIGLFLNKIGIGNFEIKVQIAVIAIFAVFFLVGKTAISVFMTRRILSFMSLRGAAISSRLMSKLLAQPLTFIQKFSMQELIFAVNRGVELVALYVIATSVVIVADISLLFFLFAGLLIVDPLTSLSTVTVFGLIAFILYKAMHGKAQEIGNLSSKLSIVSNDEVSEVLTSYRETIVRNRQSFYLEKLTSTRNKLSIANAEISFMPYVSKYVIETALIIGALLIGGIQFIFQDSVQAVSNLTIFLAAGSRIAPAILRIQQGSILLKNSIGASQPTLDLIALLGEGPEIKNSSDLLSVDHKDFSPSIDLVEVSYAYPDNSIDTLKNINLTVNPGVILAIVGPSGSGKSTLADVILGLLEPRKGHVLVSGEKPLDSYVKYPGATSYVPQDVQIVNGSIRENIALGFSIESATDELVQHAIAIASLKEFVESLPDGLETNIGERGSKISGGQRQRIGIARALFTKPKLIVLDEATSALDGGTEESISKDLHNLKGATTVVLIAHRLSTVRDADVVIYMDKGEIIARGTFEEVRSTVPDFDRQAKLMGL